MTDTIDSNVTGARIALEATPGVLPGTPVWKPLEPNSYSDFGGQLTTKPRNPINPSRQRRKGSVVDLDASGGFASDFTETGLLELLQGFCFADANIPADTIPYNGTAAVTLTTAASIDKSVNAAAGLDIFTTDDVVLLSGFPVAANNGVFTVASAIATKVTFDEAVVDDVPTASSRIQKIGVQTTDLSVAVTGSVVEINTAGAVDFTTWPIFVGSWIFIGSDTNKFATAGNQCFARVDAITATKLTLGKTTKQMVTEGLGPVVDIMIPNMIRNQPNPDDIKRRTYQIERTLGRDADGVMSEYLTGAVANEFTLNVPTADFLAADLTYVARDNEQRTGLVGVKSGTRPSLVTEDAYNTSSDVRRLRLGPVDVLDAFPAALFGYATEGTISINNGVTPNKAIGVLGAFEMTAGQFEVGGNLTAYFSNVTAVQAVRNNTDVTLDLVVVKNNAGWVIDVPLLALGDGRLNVEANQPITLPLETSAAESVLGHTLLFARFAYLPAIA